MPELVEFAVRRHGFGNTDGGFGITYPGDLDDFDHALGVCIPEGFLKVYAFWGPPEGYELVVPEFVYLTTLAEVLSEAGYTIEAVRACRLAEEQKASRSVDQPDSGS
jgi:hypothetical protein